MSSRFNKLEANQDEMKMEEGGAKQEGGGANSISLQKGVEGGAGGAGGAGGGEKSGRKLKRKWWESEIGTIQGTGNKLCKCAR